MNELRPRKGKGGRWFVERTGAVSFGTREEAEAYIASGENPLRASAPGARLIRKLKANQLVMSVGTVAILVLAGGAYIAHYNSPAQKRARTTAELKVACADVTMAFVMSQRFVEERLKSPGSAKFPLITDGVSSVATEDCRFRVDAYVDAQNGFGVMLRTAYSADMQYDPAAKRWRALKLQMAER